MILRISLVLFLLLLLVLTLPLLMLLLVLFRGIGDQLAASVDAGPLWLSVIYVEDAAWVEHVAAVTNAY